MTLMDSLLQVAAIFVQPDWQTILSLFPALLLVLFVAWFAWTARKYATLGPRRRQPARIQPITPAHVHMPGGSIAPILAALGTAALFFGLVAGGIALWVGIGLLVVTLLVWFREGMRDYDHLATEDAAARRLPAVVHPGPPPGVHMPGPSIRPLMGALGTAALLGGLVVGGWVLILAIVFLVYTLLGWLVDFTAEYRMVEAADHTGHLENIPARPLPTRSLQVFGVLLAVLALAQAGIFPPTSPTDAGGPGASPDASGGPPAGSGGPGPGGPLAIVAKDIAYDKHELQSAADAPFTIDFTNDDPATITHDIDLRDSGGTVIADEDPIPGGQSTKYSFEPLAAGSYQFFCSIHPGVPGMEGTLTIQ